jgi:hypothetical protein
VNRFNYQLDTAVTAAFLAMVALIVLLAAYEWIRLLQGSRDATPRESAPVWLPERKLREPAALPALGCVALAAALARELSTEADLERHMIQAQACCDHHQSAEQRGTPVGPTLLHALDREAREKAYLEITERKFKGVNRCC